MEAPVASQAREFAHLERQLDAADADIELVKKRLGEAQGKCHYLVNAVGERSNFKKKIYAHARSW